MSRRDGDETTEFPEDLVAVCLDANAMSRGRLDVEMIGDLVDVIESQELAVEVWIPEPVVWEWAEHLASELATAHAKCEAVVVQADAAGNPDLVGSRWDRLATADEVVDGLLTALNELDGVNVLRLQARPQIAVEALRDQVLLRGAGRRKSNTKTGAADSASFRLAEAELAQYAGKLVVVSGDRDAPAHFDGRTDVMVVNSLTRAKAGIVAMRPGSEIAAERVEEAIRARLPHLTRRELGFPPVDSESLGNTRSRLRGRVVHMAVELESIERVLNVTDVLVSSSDGYATANVDANVSVERELQVLSDINDVVEMDVESFGPLGASLEVSAESDNGLDWEVVVDRVLLE